MSQALIQQAASPPPPPPAPVSVSVCSAFEETGLDRGQWDQFVSRHAGDLYMSFDWLRVWWQHYGKRRQLRLFVARIGDQVVGILPMFVESCWLGPVRLRWARLLGCDFLPAVVSPVLVPEHAPAILRHACTSLIEKDRCDAIAFGPLSDAAGVPAHIRTACANMTETVSLAQDAQPGIHTVFTLPDSFDAWQAGLNKRQKQNLRRDLNLFAKNFASKVDVVTAGDELTREFAAFRTMHDAQWKAEHKLGHFGDWPGSAEFNDSLVRELAPLNRVRLVRLWADGKVCSYQYALTFGDRLYWRLPARLVGEQWDRFGMGRLGLVKMIEAAIGEGIRWIEGGPGHYEYKVQLGGKEVPLISQVLVARSAKSRICWALFQRAARLLHLLYYRIWFLKVAPRMGKVFGSVKNSALWPLWIRTRC